MMNRLIHLLIIIFALVNLAASPVAGQDSPISIPPGFYLVTSSIGTQLYRKDYPKGNPDFVQVIDLSQGASLELLHGEISKPGTERGDYGGDNPRFLSKSLEDYWSVYNVENPTAFCITNGQFFYLTEYPTRLALPLKIDEKIITEGSGYDQYPWEKLFLEIWDDRADITRLSRWNLHTSSAPDLIAGLAEDANKKPNSFTGRTFIGVDDRDSNGKFEIILIFNTLTSTQENAASILRGFGADKVMMLDGGGSTQLICQGQDLVKSDRILPQVIAVSRGAGPDYAGAIVDEKVIPVLLESEQSFINLEILNFGALPWLPEDDQVVIASDTGESRVVFDLEKPVFTGEKLSLTYNIPSSTQGGVIVNQVSLLHKGVEIRLNQEPFSFILLPQRLSDKKDELVSNLETWAEQDQQGLSALSNEWIQNQVDSPKNQKIINVPALKPPEEQSSGGFSYILFIPFAIFVISLGLLIINRRISAGRHN